MAVGSKKLLILSLDGASWEGLKPFQEQGKLSTLKALVQSGSSGSLHAMLPTFTYPNWAGFWRGENPSRHNIFAFKELGTKGVLRGLVDWNSLKSPTWLELVSARGLKVVSVHTPLTAPPRAVNGFLVADQHIRRTEDFTYPVELADELTSRFDNLHLPKSEQFFPSEGFGHLGDVREFVQKQIQSVQQTEELAEYLLKKSSWDVGLVHLFAPDPLQHALWHFVDPGHCSFSLEGHREVSNFFAALDVAIGRLIEIAKPEAVMLFSAHGFTSTRKILNLSRLFWEKGILRSNRFAKRLSRGFRGILGYPQRKDGSVSLDCKAIYVYKKERKDNAITDDLIGALESLEDPANGCSVIRKAWRAQQLYGVRGLPEWDIIVLEFTQGYTGRNGDIKRPVLWSCRPNQDYLIGTHTQTGLWTFSGREVTAGQNLQAGILNLAPTILTYLGVSVPGWMQANALPIFHSQRIIEDDIKWESGKKVKT